VYIATAYITNNGGIGIKEIKYGIDDYVVFDIVTDKVLSTHKRKIYYSVKRGAYFRWGGNWYLDEFMAESGG
jgi:hypothetical protein